MSTIAELFVSLGIKGSDKTIAALISVKRNMQGIAQETVKASSALTKMFNDLERLLKPSADLGFSLGNLGALLGAGNTDILQRYQQVAKDKGYDPNEISAMFKRLSSAFTHAANGDGAPRFLSTIGYHLKKNYDNEAIKRFQEHPAEFFKDIVKYLQTDQDLARANMVVKDSFGLGDDLISAIRKDVFSEKNLANARPYSEKEVQALTHEKEFFSTLSNQMSLFIGKLNAWTIQALDAAALGGANSIKSNFPEYFRHPKDHKGPKGTPRPSLEPGTHSDGTPGTWRVHPDKLLKELMTELKEKGIFRGKNSKGRAVYDKEDPLYFAPTSGHPNHNHYRPKVQQLPGRVPQSTQNINVNQNLNFQHDGKDARQTGDSVKKAVQEAYRQMPAIGVGA